mmetsp:Transcript_3708/g.7688  ORF Transcript_3708/g.7688 Transcript_3708/m.7688 type:complete len:214 (-) Transcript_3708:519-1160(-)
MDIVRFSMPSPSPRPPDAVLGSCGDDGNRKLLDIGNDLKLPAAAATSAFCASTASLFCDRWYFGFGCKADTCAASSCRTTRGVPVIANGRSTTVPPECTQSKMQNNDTPAGSAISTLSRTKSSQMHPASLWSHGSRTWSTRSARSGSRMLDPCPAKCSTSESPARASDTRLSIASSMFAFVGGLWTPSSLRMSKEAGSKPSANRRCRQNSTSS